MKYFYGQECDKIFNHTEIKDAIEYVLVGGICHDIEIIEKVASRKSGTIFCSEYHEVDPKCDRCESKEFIRQSRWCVHKGYGLIETGAKYLYSSDGESHFNKNNLIKLSGRKKIKVAKKIIDNYEN